VAAQAVASDGTPSPETARQNRIIGFLPQAEQDRVVRAYNSALAKNPELKTEEDDLAQVHPDAQMSPKDRMAFIEKSRSHQEKVRQAMLKEDATLGPILDKIDKHLSEMRARQAKALDDGAAVP